MSRLVGRVGSVAICAFFLLPLSSVFLRLDLPLGLKIVVAVVGTTAASWPPLGAALVALLVPLSLGLSVSVGGLPAASISECLMIAFAAGASLRVGWPAELRGRLYKPAAILAAAVVTSAFVDLMVARAVAPARPFFRDMWAHLIGTYWTDDAPNWLVLHDAVRWCSVLMTAVAVERIAGANAVHRRVLSWVWVSGAAAASTFTVMRLAELAARGDGSFTQSIWWVFTHVRLSVLFPDPNATGSLFAFLLVAAFVMGMRRRIWWLLMLVVPLLVVPFAFAQSRAALGAMILVGLAWWLSGRTHRRRIGIVAAFAAIVVVGAAATWMTMSRSHASPREALELRAQMAQVGVRMAARFPVFGVGLSDYARTSRRFIPPEFTALAAFAPQGENAHNNFLQVLVELGIPAGVVFTWLVSIPVVAYWRTRRTAVVPEYEGLALGLTAFLASALFGHPLLVPEIAAMFFLGLGLAASHLDGAPSRGTTTVWLMWSGTAFYVLSVVWRVRW